MFCPGYARICATPCFRRRRRPGGLIEQGFGLDDIRLKQIRTVLSGVSTGIIAVLAVFFILLGSEIRLDEVGNFFTVETEKLGWLSTVQDHILNALLALAVGIYAIRATHRWLRADYLPTLDMEAGLRASLAKLFGNFGYVSLALVTLSILGVKWDNLAWIISALSVGIGFGLQEIVKNFVSGLILLTERLVKVGDLVSINGVDGDIRQINVRATEIQLSDQSTLIVPNSQLISQSVRNVTMSNKALGIATLTLTFPLTIDPEQARDLLLGVYGNHPAILDKPVPT